MTWDREPPRAATSLAWIVPLAMSALVAVLAWRLYRQGPEEVHDRSASERPVTARGDLAEDERATIELFRRASPAVVQVTNLQVFTDMFGQNPTEYPQGAGSGFVWDTQGYIVTNFHVVANGSSFAVTFSDHSVFDAKAVGWDATHDIAVLKIDPKDKQLPALPVGTSRDLRVGQKVFAIGNPFGLDQSLTTGIISGLGREIMAPPPVSTPIQNVIQTDAAINPGNSGGPLLDSAGRLIGVNAQIASPSRASAGIGFAIPVDTVNRIVPSIIRTGKYLRPGLGVVTLPDWAAAQFQLPGVTIQSFLPNSAAARAGLRASRISGTKLLAPGDSIVKIGDQKIDSRADLFRALDSHEIGQEVSVVYIRDGREETAKLTLVGVE